jgi:hypothetical protein
MNREEFLFNDIIADKEVYQYRDKFGYCFMANKGFTFFKFRVKIHRNVN